MDQQHLIFAQFVSFPSQSRQQSSTTSRLGIYGAASLVLGRQELDPQIWQRLPTDVLIRVMHHAPNSRSRKDWLQVVSTNRLLIRHAIEDYYSDFTISRENILRGPSTIVELGGRDETEILRATKKQLIKLDFLDLLRLGAPDSLGPGELEMIRRYAARRMEFGVDLIEYLPVPATFIRRLTLNCLTGYRKGLHVEGTETHFWEESIKRLKKHLTSLVALEQYGSLPEVSWCHILDFKALESLSIRRMNTLNLEHDWVRDPASLLCRLRRWNELATLQHLQHLSVGFLMYEEALRLARAVRQLSRLRTLSLHVPNYKRGHYPIAHGRTPPAMARFLWNIFNVNLPLPWGFPRTLERLTLVDGNKK